MKKIISLSIVIFYSICVFAQNNTNLVLEKSFGVVNEYLGSVFLIDNKDINCTAYLVMKDNAGNVLSEIPAQLKDGKAEFKMFIPPSLAQGWYHLFAFTKSNTSNDYIELSQTSIPIYELDKGVEGHSTNSNKAKDFIKCSEGATSGLSFYQSSEIDEIDEIINIKVTDKSKTSNDERSQNYQILLNVAGDSHLKNFNAFYDFREGKMKALRKFEGNTYSLEVNNLTEALQGQVVSVNAFGKLELLKAKQINSDYQLPTFEPENSKLPYTKEIQEYIVRHKKRLKVVNLYDQTFSQASSEIAQKSVDVEFFTKDYIQFNNVIEFINEVLQVVKYNERKDKFSVLSIDKKFSTEPPLLILDEKVVLEPGDLIDVNYKQVISIEIVRSKETLRNFYSIFGKNGVVILKSKLNTSKYQEFDFQWNDHNKINYLLQENGGPNFYESGISLEKAKTTIPVYADIIQTWKFSGNEWTSEVCKVGMDQ